MPARGEGGWVFVCVWGGVQGGYFGKGGHCGFAGKVPRRGGEVTVVVEDLDGEGVVDGMGEGGQKQRVRGFWGGIAWVVTGEW